MGSADALGDSVAIPERRLASPWQSRNCAQEPGLRIAIPCQVGPDDPPPGRQAARGGRTLHLAVREALKDAAEAVEMIVPVRLVVGDRRSAVPLPAVVPSVAEDHD